MAIEKQWTRQGPIAFTADGGEDGLIIVSNVQFFKTKQKIVVSSNTQPDLQLEVKRVVSLTQLYVGPRYDAKNRKVDQLKLRADVSAYTVADNATIRAEEQSKVTIPKDDIWQAVYEFEPTVALRTLLVDRVGNDYTLDNPLPVQLSDGSISIGTVNAELEVQLSHRDNFPDAGDVADSVQVGDEATIAKVDPDNRSWSMNRYEKLLPLLANANWLKLGDYDEIAPVFAGSVATLDYKQNGATIARGIFNFVTDANWSMKLERYINDASGDILLDDDDQPLFLD